MFDELFSWIKTDYSDSDYSDGETLSVQCYEQWNNLMRE